MEHEEQGMIYDMAYPVMDSKVLKALNTVTFLVEMQMLSDWHLVKHETTHAIFIRHCLYIFLEYIKYMGINARPKLESV